MLGIPGIHVQLKGGKPIANTPGIVYESDMFDNYFYSNEHDCLGDVIQTTAIAKWFARKSIVIYYQDTNRLCPVPASELFPSGLVRFVTGNDKMFPRLSMGFFWSWTAFFRAKHCYTEVSSVYGQKEPDLDIVMVPLVSPGYNFEREFNAKMVNAVFSSVLKKWPNSVLVLDKAKCWFADLLNVPNIILSENFQQTFDLIHRSKVYIGGDTGTSHFAGAIKHPRMLLLYPKLPVPYCAIKTIDAGLEAKLNFIVDNDLRERGFQNSGLMLQGLDQWNDSTPCCDHSHVRFSKLVNGNVDVDKVMHEIERMPL